MRYAHLLVTGGAGFIGSGFVRFALAQDAGLHVTNLDLLTYSGNPANVADVARAHGPGGDGRYHFVEGDVCDADRVAGLLGAGEPPGAAPPIDAIVHFAAESHVDRSILGPLGFVRTNVHGAATLLECARRELEARPRAFRVVHVSTDEVYGSLGADDPPFTEHTPLRPNSPYSASKAGSDHMVRAYVETFGLPAVITRCSNNYGPRQHPEKLVPLMITRALADAPLPVYGDGLNVRDWLYVEDHCAALWAVLERGIDGHCYNIGGDCERSNLDLVRAVLALLGKPESLIRFVDDRPGHDRRYAMDIGHVRGALGWQPSVSLEEGLETTVRWYRDHREWWEPLLPGTREVTGRLYGV